MESIDEMLEELARAISQAKAEEEKISLEIIQALADYTSARSGFVKQFTGIAHAVVDPTTSSVAVYDLQRSAAALKQSGQE